MWITPNFIEQGNDRIDLETYIFSKFLVSNSRFIIVVYVFLYSGIWFFSLPPVPKPLAPEFSHISSFKILVT